MISKTKISIRTERKTNPQIVEAIKIAKKNNLLEVAKKLSGPKKLQISINVDEISRLKENKLLIVGKVLGSGNIDKKISVSALSFSKQAMEKLKKAGCEVRTIKEEMEKNPKLEGVKII